MKSTKLESSCVYYVDRRFCDGRKCRYVGIHVKDFRELMRNQGWSIKIDVDENTSVTADYNTIEHASSNADAAYLIRKYIIDEAGVFISGLHFRDVSNNDKAILYIRYGVVELLSGNNADHIDYLGENKSTADIYHLCRNISYNIGTCRESKEASKRSNIYCVKHPETGKWSNGGFPVIMANCKLCDQCISNCPRHAIHNKIDGSHRTVTELGVGDEIAGAFTEQYYKNAQAKDGDIIYDPRV